MRRMLLMLLDRLELLESPARLLAPWPMARSDHQRQLPPALLDAAGFVLKTESAVWQESILNPSGWAATERCPQEMSMRTA